MIDAIQLPTEEFKKERTEIHLEFQENYQSNVTPTVPYMYGIIIVKEVNDFVGTATLAIKQGI